MEVFKNFLRSYVNELSCGNIPLWFITILSIILSVGYSIRTFRKLGGKNE